MGELRGQVGKCYYCDGDGRHLGGCPMPEVLLLKEIAVNNKSVSPYAYNTKQLEDACRQYEQNARLYQYSNTRATYPIYGGLWTILDDGKTA